MLSSLGTIKAVNRNDRFTSKPDGFRGSDDAPVMPFSTSRIPPPILAISPDLSQRPVPASESGIGRQCATTPSFRSAGGRWRPFRPEPAARADRRPLPDGEPGARAGDRSRAEGDRGAAGDRARLQDLLRQGEPHIGSGRARRRARRGAADVRRNPRDRSACPCLTDVHESGQCANRRRGRGRAADPGVPLPPDGPSRSPQRAPGAP